MNKGNIYDLCKIGRNKSYYVAIVALGYLIKFVIHNHRDHRPKSQQKFQQRLCKDTRLIVKEINVASAASQI